MPGARTISDVVSAAAERDFVGRQDEVALLRDAAAAGAPRLLVVFVTGPGGIGKSRLVRAALDDRAGGGGAGSCDCGAIEPTPGRVPGRARRRRRLRPRPSPRSRRPRRRSAADGRRAVLALDNYERFVLLDTWLRQVFLPGMPGSLLTVIAGRDTPGAAWLAAPGWAGLVHELRLGPLSQSESIALLRRRGVTRARRRADQRLRPRPPARARAGRRRR